jgi:hypothetical protein
LFCHKKVIFVLPIDKSDQCIQDKTRSYESHVITYSYFQREIFPSNKLNSKKIPLKMLFFVSHMILYEKKFNFTCIFYKLQ